jgi:hypothetical protein
LWEADCTYAQGSRALVTLLFILVWGMFAGWIAHLLLARDQPNQLRRVTGRRLGRIVCRGLLTRLLRREGAAPGS